MPGSLELLIASIVVVLCCLLSFIKKHGVEKDLFIAGLRTVLQVLFLGFALKWIFAHPSLLVSVLVGLFMTVNSAINSRSRIKNKYPKLMMDSLFATVISIWPLTLVGSYLLKAEPWWQADLFLPLLGMLLGNVLSGISLGIDNFTHEVKTGKEELMTLTALGASTEEATSSLFKRSVRIGLTPLINAMTSMGLVSIPGMMTGQIIGGQAPEEAAIVQVITILLMAPGVYLGVITGLKLATRRLFDERGLPCS